MNFLSDLTKKRVFLFRQKLVTPMLMWTGIKLVEDSPSKVHMLVPLNWRTINSWKTMFFAGIAAGVDVTGGYASFGIARKHNIGVLYKDMHVKFLRRVDDDLNLICTDIDKI